MGNSRWDNDSYRSYSQSTGFTPKAAASHVFTGRGQVDEKLDPRNVKVGKGARKGLQLRESIISESNPHPTPIILALDVTGSMGEVARQIATEELPKLMTEIHDKSIVSDPHVMFMGVDDVYAQGHGALQVSYFEPDLKIVEQLRKLWLVGNGGGNGSESYDLPWYFAGKYTYLEGFEKQNRKGFLFTFGDEDAPFQTMQPHHLRDIFGPGDYEATSPAESLRLAQQKFNVFHIVVERGRQNRALNETWKNLLGPNVLFMRDRTKLTEIVLATMAIADGANVEEVLRKSECKDELLYAFDMLEG